MKAEGTSLPRGVVITVKYGSGEEVYDAEHPVQTPKVVFCKQVLADGGAIGGDASDQDASGPVAAEAIVCDLWTDGAATIKVKATGYAEVEQNLKTESDECGLKLAKATITIEPGD